MQRVRGHLEEELKPSLMSPVKLEPPRAVDVECYAGYRGEETPRRVRFAESIVEITEVVNRWLDPDHRYFRVTNSRGDLYTLRHDVAAERWELTFFRAADLGAQSVSPDQSRSSIGNSGP